jgi:UDP-glucose 4-epimerase
MINRIAAGGEVYIDNPDERGAWLYVHDCVKAVMLVWNANRPAERIYTVSGSVHSIREVAQIAMKYCPGSKIVFSEKTTEPSPYATNFDDSPIKRDLGWKAEYTIEEAVRDHLSVVLNKDL